MILYLHPPRNLTTPGFYTIPAGLFGVINELIKTGYQVIGYNLSIEMVNLKYLPIKQIMQSVQPQAVLIDLHWYEHTAGAIQTAEIVKRFNPNCIVVLGGLSATIFAEDILKFSSCIDYIVRGEGERPIVQLFNYIFKGHGNPKALPNLAFRANSSVVMTPISFQKKGYVDSYNYTDFSWLKNAELYLHTTPEGINSYYKNFWLLIGNGCLYDCAYCGGGKSSIARSFGRSTIWVRPVDKVFSDIVSLYNNGVQIINPTHDFSMLGKKFWEKLFNRLQKTKIFVGLYLEVFQLPSRQFIEEFSKTFDLSISTLVFSPLTGNEEQRRLNGKFYTNRGLIDRLDCCKQNGVTASLGFSKNLPGTTISSENEQNDFLNDIYTVYPEIDYYSQEITLDPESEMARNPEKYKIKKRFNNFSDYYNYSLGNKYSIRLNGYDLQTNE